MARGNDSESARRDLDASGMTSSQWGGFANAEDLIAAQHEKYDAELNAALNKPVDVDATAALDLDDIEPQYDDGEIKDAAVRGGRLVVVEEVNGRLVKWSEPHGPQRGSAPARAKSEQGSAGEAPSGVTVPTIQAKLDELNIDADGKTRKDDLWGLLPEDERAKLAS